MSSFLPRYMECQRRLVTRKLSVCQNGRFPTKIALCLKKVCCKVSLCENC